MKTKALILSLAIISALFTSASAAIFIGTDYRSFEADTTYDEDIYIGGNSIRFQSNLTGDLLGGSRDLVFSGHCEGDLMWGAQHITIKGPVDRTVRVFAQDIEVNAPIGRDLLAFGGVIIIGPGTRVMKNGYLFGDNVQFNGFVGEDLRIEGNKVSISGTINGNLNIEAKNLEIRPNTVIEGNLIYKTPEKAKIESSVRIAGETKWTELPAKSQESKYKAFKPITFFVDMFLVFNFILSMLVFIITLLLGNSALIPLMFLALIICGIVIVSLNRNFAARAVGVLEKRFFASFGLGILLIFLFPIASFLALISFIGIPLAILLLSIFGIVSFIGSIYAAQFVGCGIGRLLNLGRRPLSILTLIIGIVVLAGLVLIPVVGWIIAFIVISSGFGSVILSLERFRGSKRVEDVRSTVNE